MESIGGNKKVSEILSSLRHTQILNPTPPALSSYSSDIRYCATPTLSYTFIQVIWGEFLCMTQY